MNHFEVEEHETIEYIVVEIKDNVRECVCKCGNGETALKIAGLLCSEAKK